MCAVMCCEALRCVASCVCVCVCVVLCGAVWRCIYCGRDEMGVQCCAVRYDAGGQTSEEVLVIGG